MLFADSQGLNEWCIDCTTFSLSILILILCCRSIVIPFVLTYVRQGKIWICLYNMNCFVDWNWNLVRRLATSMYDYYETVVYYDSPRWDNLPSSILKSSIACSGGYESHANDTKYGRLMVAYRCPWSSIFLKLKPGHANGEREMRILVLIDLL